MEPISSSAIYNQCNRREVDWIHLRIFQIEPLPNPELTREVVRDYLDFSTDNCEVVENLARDSVTQLLPDTHLEWIDRNNSRLLRWLHHYCFREQPRGIPPTFTRLLVDIKISEPRIYDHVIQRLDSWSIPIQEKEIFITRAKLAWSNIIIQEEKKMAWLDKHNETQVKWVWGFIKQNWNPPLDLLGGTVNLYSPENMCAVDANEMFSCVHTFFDCWSRHPAELKEFRAKVKRSWAQQKYRINLDGRKQSTFVLSVKAKKQLKDLSKARNINMNQMLEYIIDEEAKRNSHKKQ